MVCAVGIALIVFFYSGTFFHWHGVKDIFNAYAAWFKTGHEGHGHEKAVYYWVKLMAPSFEKERADFLGYELPALAGLILCVFCLRFKNISSALSRHLRRRHTHGLQHRPLQNALVHHQHHLAVPVYLWGGLCSGAGRECRIPYRSVPRPWPELS